MHDQAAEILKIEQLSNAVEEIVDRSIARTVTGSLLQTNDIKMLVSENEKQQTMRTRYPFD